MADKVGGNERKNEKTKENVYFNVTGDNASTATSVGGKQSGGTHHDGVADDEAMAIEEIGENVVVKQNRMRSVNGSMDEHVCVDVT